MPIRLAVARAGSISSGWSAGSKMTSMPSVFPALTTRSSSPGQNEVLWSTRYPIRVTAGTSSCSSCNFFPGSPSKSAMPVTLPPGRFRRSTNPKPTGSPTVTKTIGMVVVAFLAAIVAPGSGVTNTSTRRPMRSATNAGTRLRSLSAQRYSTARLRPSTKPPSLRPLCHLASHGAAVSGLLMPRKPTTGVLGCWAPETSGHAAARAAISGRRSRRLTRSPRRRGRAAQAARSGQARSPFSD